MRWFRRVFPQTMQDMGRKAVCFQPAGSREDRR